MTNLVFVAGLIVGAILYPVCDYAAMRLDRYLMSNRRFRGWFVERVVRFHLSKMKRMNVRVLNNVLLPSDGRTTFTEIDHIVVSSRGIFCIETKSHKGKVKGSGNDANWVQFLGGKSYQFANPIRQNRTHIKAIEAVLAAWSLPIVVHSVVVFPAAWKVEIRDTANVIKSARELRELISNFQDEILSSEHQAQSMKALNEANRSDRKRQNKHRKEVGKLFKSSETHHE